MADGGEPDTGELTGLLGAVLVLYADRALGPSGVKEVMDRVGAQTVVSLVENWEEWVSFDIVLRVAVAVADLCHEPDIGRRTGEELFRVLQERGLLVLPNNVSLIDALPDVVASLNTATDLRQATVIECVEGLARIEVTTKDEGRTRFLCRTLLGLYSLIPGLCHAIGAVVETRCVHRGDDLCEFQVRWRATAKAEPGYDPWAERVERLQEWAVNLAGENTDHAPAALEAAVLLDEIRSRALLDPLTGLSNRVALELRANDEARRRNGVLDGLTLLFVDLDNFKPINDTYGHGVGDELLVRLGARLQGAVRDADLVARVGGDEFVVLLSDASDEQTATLLHTKVHAVFKDPFLLGGELLHLSGSIGVARAPEHGQTLEGLLRHADQAMYAVKRARKDAPPRPG